MYTAQETALYILGQCMKRGHPANCLQLQDTLFAAQAHYLWLGTPLFNDDFEAWAFGPCLPSVYYRYCGYGAEPIDMLGRDLPFIKETDRIILFPIIERYGTRRLWERVSSRKGGAWDHVWQNGSGNHKVISKEMIRNYEEAQI